MGNRSCCNVYYLKPANLTQKAWSYDLPFFLMANLAVGGSMCGEIDDYVRYFIDINDPFHEESFKVLNDSLCSHVKK